MSKLPVLFLGHGSPMNTLFENNKYNVMFKNLSKTFPKPDAILSISAHWCSRRTEVMTGEKPDIIYDFYGFPRELYELKYPAKGSPALAQKVTDLLSGIQVYGDKKRGLDHGSWCVLSHMYSNADIPVIQLSIDITKTPEEHWRLAEKLKPLREQNVLILCSGDIIHNLRELDFDRVEDIVAYDWSKEFHDKINEAIMKRDKDTIVNFDKLRYARLAVPMPSDHYLPFVYAMALADPSDKIEIFNDDIIGGSLSMTSVRIG